MRTLSLIVIISVIYLIPIKNLYDDIGYLDQDILILELEHFEKDRLINKLNKQNDSLIKTIQELKINLVIIKPKRKEKKETSIVDVINDTL